MRPCSFTPSCGKYAGRRCTGYQIMLEPGAEYHSLIHTLQLIRHFKDTCSEFVLEEGFEAKLSDQVLLDYVNGLVSTEEMREHVKVEEQKPAEPEKVMYEAQAGETVTLLANLAETVTLNKSVKLDVNGYNVTEIVLADANVTVAAGAFTVNDKGETAVATASIKMGTAALKGSFEKVSSADGVTTYAYKAAADGSTTQKELEAFEGTTITCVATKKADGTYAAAANDKAVAVEALKNATSVIEAAASKGVYHKNNAARKVSRLAKLVNGIA